MQRTRYNRGTGSGLPWFELNELNRSLDRLDVFSFYGHRDKRPAIPHRFTFDGLVGEHQALVVGETPAVNRWIYGWSAAYWDVETQKWLAVPDGVTSNGFEFAARN